MYKEFIMKNIKNPEYIAFSSKEALENLLIAGGFAVSRFNSEYAVYDSVHQLLQGNEDMSNIEKIMDLPIGAPFVSMHKDFIKEISPEAVQAILLHEEGHIALGHYVHYSELGHNLQHELEADAYAAARVGKSAVAEALKESLRVLIPYMGVPENERDDCLNHVLNSENMLPRFEALKWKSSVVLSPV